MQLSHLLALLREPLSLRDLAALLVVQASPDRSLRVIARALGVAPPLAYRSVSALVDAGLVARRSDPDDGRLVRLRLTERGEAEVVRLAGIGR